MGFSFQVKALRLIFKAFSIRFVDTCSLHAPFMFPYLSTPTHQSNIRPLSDHYPTTIRPQTTTIPEKTFSTLFRPYIEKVMLINPISIPCLKWPILIFSPLFENRIPAVDLHETMKIEKMKSRKRFSLFKLTKISFSQC